MARLQFGKLGDSWQGEASDFTPMLAEQLARSSTPRPRCRWTDALGDVIGVDLAPLGESEVQAAGGRRIGTVATGDDGSEFVVEDQYRTS